MKTYSVVVTRLTTETQTVEIKAESADDAIVEAIDEANAEDCWDEHGNDYECDVRLIEDEDGENDPDDAA